MGDIDELIIRFSTSAYPNAGDFLESEVSVGDIRSARRCIAIADDGEPLQPIPDSILLMEPHRYQSLGAPYADYSPWFLRETVVQKLVDAQARLTAVSPGSRLLIVDAFRPPSVQHFMVNHECDRLAQSRGFSSFNEADAESQQRIQGEVLQFWAPPTSDPTAPSPHSTGSALDLTIVGPVGLQLDMGTAVDELVPASLPAYFKDTSIVKERNFHANRELLRQVMEGVGFRRLPTEWWHFSYGDQMWALIQRLENKGSNSAALYGGV